MLISTWLTAVRDRFDVSRTTKRRTSQKKSSSATEHLEQRALLTTTLQAVRPNVGEFLVPDEVRTVAPQELTLQFSLGSTITPSTISSQSIQVLRSNYDGVFGDGNDVPVTIGYVGAGSTPNEVVLRFGETLQDEHYRIVVRGAGSGANSLAATRPGSTPGSTVADPVTSTTFDFELDLGARVVAVDPQPVIRNSNGSLSQDRDKIVLYFNEDELDPVAAEDVNFYQLIFTNETVSTLDDTVHLPTAAVYDDVENTVTLTFLDDIAALSGAGSYRLRVGNSESLPQAPVQTNQATDPGSSFATAVTIPTPSTVSNTSRIITSAISPQNLVLEFPGAGDEPGHREIEVENHLEGATDSGASGIPYVAYNFRDVYGVDPNGNVLHNLITEAQKDRTREIFQFFGELSGLDFRETASSGLTIVTGDLRGLDPAIPTGPGGVAGLAGNGMAIMDMAETWDNLPGGSWFNVAMHEIGHLMGLGHTYDLPALTVMGNGEDGSFAVGVEPDYPGDHDIVHLQNLFRPDSIDIDLYRFQVDTASVVSAEIMAERLANSSPLDSVLRLYQEVDGVRELIAQNDNYFSKDSFLELTLEPGVYFIGVSSTGNDAYDPTIANTGIGGTSQGVYDLRLNFRPNVSGAGSAIVDTTGRTFDGDSDGLEGGVYNFWFKTATASNTLIVDKTEVSFLASPVSRGATQIGVRSTDPFAVNDVIRIGNEQMRITAINPLTRILTVTRAVNSTSAANHSVNASIRKTSLNGQLATPFGFISDALAAAQPGQVVRIVGNGGADDDITTTADNLPYEIGVNTSNQALADGSSLEVPRGVSVQIDPGAVLKLRRGWLGVGSSTTSVDRSGSTLQVLGLPGREVIFTSWNDETIGTDTTGTPTSGAKGDWAGIIFRNEIDRAQNRYNSENDGIFINYVGYSDIRWGGGDVTINTTTQTVNPIHIERSQPTITNNTIQFSNSSAMSADPDSFEELTFHSPRFQTGKPAFTVDYKRVGPEIRGNTLLGNGNNGLFVRIDTLAGGATDKMTVPGRFDDTDIVHIISQNLEIQGTPGGAYTDDLAPSVTLVTLNTQVGGTLTAGTYNYRVVFTDENGFESPASATTGNFVLGATGSIRLSQLPPATGVYTGRRVYRSNAAGGGAYTLVGELDKTSTSFTDTGLNLSRTLVASPTRDRARIDARLSIDPGIVVKLQGARIQTGFGAQLIAEGAPGRQVIFTSRLDDRYGAGGTFDTNGDDSLGSGETTPSRGNWGGLYIGHLGSASIDRALITFAGGSTPIAGGTFAGVNPVEIHQADVRIRNTTFENNAAGTSTGSRAGLFSNAPGTIFVRAAQPVLMDNVFSGNNGAVININANALNKDIVVDQGRSTGLADVQLNYRDNQGPLVRNNIIDGNQLNGMVVRGEVLTTEGVWDDTNIVHIVQNEIYVPNLHTYGGLRLESSSTESLVVKLQGATAGFTAGGSTLDITDRIGGMLHIVGQPGQPVILTSLSDDSVGAGFDLRGLLQKDTNGNGSATAPAAGNWRGINVERYSHDRNVAVYVENEVADRFSADTNSDPASAETVVSLAEKEGWGDENLRLGVDLEGVIDNPSDVDVFSFSGVAGSQVWIDIDRTTFSLDTVVELLDSTGAILAQSDSYLAEKLGALQVVTSPGSDVKAFGLDYSQYLSDDHFSINPNDAGFRVVLPGTEGVRGTYFVRVRSSNIDSTTGAPRTDLQDNSKIFDGLTSGTYQLQIRLQEEDEFAGTTIQFADIRFATTGVNIVGQPVHSPLTGENEENETGSAFTSGVNLGNLMESDRGAMAVRGTITGNGDVDFFRFEVNYVGTQQIPGVSLVAPHVPVVFDLDYADGLARADLAMAVFDGAGRLILLGQDSNIADDQAGPLEGADFDDLTRGSVGTFDPFIGSVELPGGNYALAVFNKQRIPQVMDQYFSAISTAPLLRVEPVNSVRRVFEERFGAADQDTFTSAEQPTTNLFTVDALGNLADEHSVDYHLGDVVLFVSVNAGTKGTDETAVATLNPFTGELVTVLGSFSQPVGDIAMRPDGQLYTFTAGPNGGGQSTSGVTGNYFQIDTGTAAATNLGDDGITTNRDNLDTSVTPAVTTPGDNNVVDANAGMIISAMTFRGTGATDLFTVSRRATVTNPANSVLVAPFTTNVLYRHSITTGAVASQGAARVNDARAYAGAGTTQVEVGQIQANGTVTGLASIGNFLFAVDTAGFLYRVSPASAATTQIAFIGGNFTSLVAGPDEVENGLYANTLFAMTTTGDLVAFDTAGNLQPIFFDGQSRISTGVAGIPSNGLAFSTLDRNLWATTGLRGTNPGHGVETRFDDSVLAARQNGGASLYFGNQRGGADAGNQNNLSGGAINNVNFPGGAHGAVVSNAFSLEGYNRTDKPVLYFNYFLETEGSAFDPNTNPTTLMRDAFRVYITDGTGNWNLVSTNDSFQSATDFDEFDFGPDGSGTLVPMGQTFPDVVETFDNTSGWRQARIDLSNYAGRDDLKLRFEFSTAGSFNVGDITTTGEELYARSGDVLRDGEAFILDGVNEFEIDLGFTLVLPPATAILDGETITIQGTVFEFDVAGNGVAGANVPVVVLATDSPVALATKLQAAIDGEGITDLRTFRNGNRINVVLEPALNQFSTAVTVTQSAGAGLLLDGAPGVTLGAQPVAIHSGMTAAEVAEIMAQAMADRLLPAGVFDEVEFNNPPGVAQNLEALSWTLAANSVITDSTTLPHISILGTSDAFTGTDLYRFVVPANNSRVIVDLDGSLPTFDAVVQILNAAGDVVAASVLPAATDRGSLDLAPFIETFLDAGTFFVQVGVAPNAGGSPIPQRYTMNLSVQGHAVNAAGVTTALVVDRSNIKTSDDMISVIQHWVYDPGPMAHTTSRGGDGFGAFFASYDDANRTLRPGSLRGMNNAVEGVYIDDIVLGFAERGEMVVNAPINQAFIDNFDVTNPDYPSTNSYQGIDVGEYDIEIRRANDYATTEPAPPTNTLDFAIDTNDRVGNLVSITVPDAAEIPDGSTFVITDGINQVIFQFLDVSGVATPVAGAFPISIDAVGGQRGTEIARQIRNAINSITVQNVLKTKASLSDGTDTDAANPASESTSSTLHLTATVQVQLSAALQTVLVVTEFAGFGDQNHHRDQGQLIIQSTFVSDSLQFGISVDAADRPIAANPPVQPGPGTVRNLHTINDSRLVTSVVLSNNVLVANAAGGIRFSGDQFTLPSGVVPYGRIINNTIVGLNAGVGILVEQSASPTILNNIVANFGTGISIDGSSRAAGTVYDYTLYRGNGANNNGALETFAIVLLNSDPLFVDEANRNFYPAPLSQAIDSSVTSLSDRSEILAVKAPLDLDGRDDAGSPVLAPAFDVYGQLRGNDPDVETPGSQGASVSFDRGAIDRVDFFPPQAQLANPEDQSVIDGDPDVDEVWIDQVQILRQFRIRLIDEGIGIDNATVDSSQFVLKRVETDGITETVLIEGRDYQFVYNEVTREAIFNAETFFADANTEARYIILVDNDGTGAGDTVNGVRDRAGNFLLANRADGTTRFDIVLTDGVNDPPVNTVPSQQQTNEDTILVFSAANGNAISIFDQDAHLGTNVLTVTLTATHGVLSLGTVPAGLTFALPTMDGILDGTMTFTGTLQEINTALEGLQFVPAQDYFTLLPTFGFATLTITTDDLGEFSGPPAFDTDTINIDVIPVNDDPTFDQPTDVLLLETAAEAVLGVTLPGFLTGQSAGPANETPPQTTVAILTVTAVTDINGGASPWTISNFFDPSVPLSIDTITGDLTFKTNENVNGIATISVVLEDSLGAESAPQFFDVIITPVNDVPVYTTNVVTDAAGDNGAGNLAIDAAGNITIDEDAGQLMTTSVTVDFINTFAPAGAAALDENGLPQQLTWSVSSPVNLLGPAGGNLVFTQFDVDAAGNLTFQTAQDTAGAATFTLSLMDDGGVANGGVNTLSRTFTISVRPLNDAPVAITGNYTVDEGFGITLDASSSFDVDTFFGDTLTYAWDLNNDGVFETPTGTTAVQTFTWAYLSGLGITAPSVRPIHLRVTDQSLVTDVDTATLTTLIVDYGDALNTYGTLKLNGGAAHTINGTLFLGATIDKELTGQPTANATGDGADEDGVLFPTSIEADATRALPSYVDVISSGPGKVDLWLDLNFNGQFDHASEHLLGGVSFTVAAGTNRIPFMVPAGTMTGDSVLRVRLSSAGLLLPTGRANDGEVEDYAVKIKPLQAPTTPTFIRPFDFNLADGRIPQTSDLTPPVAWTALEQNFNYDLVVRNASNVVVFSVTRQTASSYNMPQLPAGIYTATVTAYNKVDAPAAPAVWQFQVVPLAVSSPSGDIATSRPAFNWNHVEGTKTYTVEVESLTTGSQSFFTVDATVASPPNRYVMTSDLPIGGYRVRVQAIDSVDLPGDWSPYVSFAVRTPATITAPVGTVSNLRPQITWNAVPGAVRYAITLFNVTDNVTTASDNNVLTTNWTPPSDLSLAQYRVTVIAFNNAGESSLPNASYTFTVAPTPVPAAPTGRLPDSTPTFSWSAIVGADQYELVVNRGYGDLGEVFRVSNLIGTQFTQTTAIPLGRYTYQIRAVNNPAVGSTGAAVFSSFSSVNQFTVTERPIVTSPDSTTFLSRPVITWAAPIGSSPTMVQSEVWINKIEKNSFGQTFQRNILTATNIAGNTYTVNQDLVLGTYVVWVRTYSTVDPTVVSEWSIAKTFRVTTIPTLIGPSGRITDATPTLTWEGVPGGQTYRIYVASLSNGPVVYNIPGLNALNFTVPTDLPIGRYRYWVQATSAFGDLSAWSIPKDFQVVTAPTLTGPSSSTFDTTPSFSWTNLATTLGGVPAGAQSYDFRLDRVLATSVQENFVSALGLTTTNYTVPADLPIGIYRAYIRARRSDTQGDFSSVLEFFVGGRPVVNVIGTTTDTTPTITWNSVDGASGYEIFLQIAGGTPLRQSGIGTTSYTVPQPLAKGTYRVWVRAINAATGGTSFWSEGASTTFIVVDAEEAGQSSDAPSISDFVLTAIPENVLDASTESTVSMLPSMMSGSSFVPVVKDLAAPLQMTPVSLVADETDALVANELAAEPQKDAVLSSWDEQLWWEMPAADAQTELEPAETVAVVAANRKESSTTVAGFFGALMALAPRALRRGRKDESQG